MSSTKRCGFNRYDPPSPSLAGDEDIEESFLKDVNKLHDILPQPFRRIDKLLNEIYELAWEVIEKRESEKVHKGSAKANLPKIIYEEELLVKENVECIAVSTSFLFLGSTNKIIVYELPDLKCICVHDWVIDDGNNQSNIITNIHIVAHTQDCVILLAIDDNGSLRILGFKTDTFVVIESLNTSDSSGVLTKAEHVSLSDDGVFLAVTWKDCNNTWLEVYKLPTELWFQELIQLMKETTPDNENEDEEEAPQADLHKVLHQFRLSSPEIKTNTLSLSAVMRNFDAETPLIGTGAHHCLSTNFFKHLTEEFKNKCNIPENVDLFKVNSCNKPNVHFLKGQLTSSLFPTHYHVTTFNAVAVWWENSNQLAFFLLKQWKDQPEPFFVLPHPEKITLSCVNSQTDLIATFIANGCVTIWNRYLGYPVKVFHCDEQITMLHFSTVYDVDVENRLTYITSNGKLCQVTCKCSYIKTPVCLDDRSSPVFENDHLISRVESPSNLITLIWSSGQIVIYNQLTSSALCQLEIFNDDCESNPKGRLRAVYIKQYIIVMRDENQEDNTLRSRLFIFRIDTLPILQPFILNADSKMNESDDGDRLRKYYEHFVDECRKDQNALHTRVKAQYQVLMKR